MVASWLVLCRFVDRIVQRRQTGRLAGAQVRRVHGRVCHDEIRPASVADPGVRRSGEEWHARRPVERMALSPRAAALGVVGGARQRRGIRHVLRRSVRLRSAVRRCHPAGIGLRHRCGRRCKGAAASRRRDAGAGDRTPRARCRRRPVGDSRRCSSCAARRTRGADYAECRVVARGGGGGFSVSRAPHVDASSKPRREAAVRSRRR